MNKVFLGGTCNNTTWRDALIPQLKIKYFNPVVEDWTPECQTEEIRQKESKCNIHLYVITAAMTGVFSIAELIDSAHNRAVDTVVYVDTARFNESQIRSLEAVVDLAEIRGAIVCNSLKDVANKLNGE